MLTVCFDERLTEVFSSLEDIFHSAPFNNINGFLENQD